MAGSGGRGGGSQWYVDAKNGNDNSPGTSESPFKTLSRAAIAATIGDTVNLADGTWDPSVDPKLASSATTACGISSGVAFVANVTLRAMHSGFARIVNGGYHGICMSGGLVDGLRLECGGSDRPVLETAEGSLEIRGTSLCRCSTYGIDVSGTAQVTLRPGSLTDYSEYPNPLFAVAREQSSLTIEGGKISFSGLGTQVKDSAHLALHGVTLASEIAGGMAGIAVTIPGGSPTLTLDGGTRIESMGVAIDAYEGSANVNIDDLTITNCGNAILLTLDAASLSKIAINRLVAIDNGGLGLSVGGRFDLTMTNSAFTRCGSPSVILGGSGSASLDTVTITGGWGWLLLGGDGSADGFAVKVRNVKITEGQHAGVKVEGYAGDRFDFGTAMSPGNNVFRGNNLLGAATEANFVFAVPRGVVVQAVGNTWDANQQGSDVNGWYHVGTAGVPLDVTSGTGPNYLSGTDNAGTLRLAENPPAGG